ncbi:hypothetical protein [uncultured Maribacter sp.]|uniref:hypothetical protein n=1 Tax=uncultured Maribacter sp. TaxID=431308 RepID=UPI002632B94E|nr:hypothetical protein [uncultured Maribacter sp.]
MTEIKIPKSVTHSKIKSLQKSILSNIDNSGEVTMILPSEINNYKFSLLADLLQLTITLNKKIPISKIKFEFEINDKTLESLYGQEFIYPIISLLWNTASFVDLNNENVKGKLREFQNTFFFKMNSLSRLKGNKFILTNIDHFSNNKGLIKLLENSNGFNDNEEQIIDSVRNILMNYVLTFNKNNTEEIKNIVDDIGAIVYELSKNTYEWGKTDSLGIPISPSIRGVYLKFYNNKKENITKEYHKTPLEEYFNQNTLIERSLNNKGNIYYLEIMVFDSGVGFIEKFNNKGKLSDIDVLKRCLIKNQTSAISNLKSKKGLGLDRILNILNKTGFIKISTDKYCVYRNLIKDEYKPIDINKLEDLKLEDWNKNNFSFNESEKISGSYLSILYPFKNSN